MEEPSSPSVLRTTASCTWNPAQESGNIQLLQRGDREGVVEATERDLDRLFTELGEPQVRENKGLLESQAFKTPGVSDGSLES